MSAFGKIVRIGTAAAIALAVPGCGVFKGGLNLGRNSDVLFEGERFRRSARAIERGDQSRFVATARPVSASLNGARQAAEYEAISHCINFFGTSAIQWDIGPDTPVQNLKIDGDTLTFVGTCVES